MHGAGLPRLGAWPAGAASSVASGSFFPAVGAPVHSNGAAPREQAPAQAVASENWQCVTEIPASGADGVAYVHVGGQSLLFSGGRSGTVRVGDSRSAGGPVCKMTGPSRWVSSIVSAGRGAGCVDGDVLAASCSPDRTVQLWGEHPTARGKLCALHTLESNSGQALWCLDVTPGAERVVAGGQGRVHVWTRRRSAGTAASARGADAYAAIALSGHTAWVYAVQVSRTGECIVSASWDGSVCVWRVTMDEHAATDRPPQKVAFRGHDNEHYVSSLALAADGKTAYAGVLFGSEIAVVDCESAREVATLWSDKVESRVRCLSFLESSGGVDSVSGRLFAGHDNGVISEWDLESRTCSTVHSDPRSHEGGVVSIAVRLSEQGSDSGDAVAVAEATRDGPRRAGAGAGKGGGRYGDRAICCSRRRGVEVAALHWEYCLQGHVQPGMVRIWRTSASLASGENSALFTNSSSGTVEAGAGIDERAMGSPVACEPRPRGAISGSADGGTPRRAGAPAMSGMVLVDGAGACPAVAASAVAPDKTVPAARAAARSNVTGDAAVEHKDKCDAGAGGASIAGDGSGGSDDGGSARGGGVMPTRDKARVLGRETDDTSLLTSTSGASAEGFKPTANIRQLRAAGPEHLHAPCSFHAASAPPAATRIAPAYHVTDQEQTQAYAQAQTYAKAMAPVQAQAQQQDPHTQLNSNSLAQLTHTYAHTQEIPILQQNAGQLAGHSTLPPQAAGAVMDDPQHQHHAPRQQQAQCAPVAQHPPSLHMPVKHGTGRGQGGGSDCGDVGALADQKGNGNANDSGSAPKLGQPAANGGHVAAASGVGEKRCRGAGMSCEPEEPAPKMSRKEKNAESKKNSRAWKKRHDPVAYDQLCRREREGKQKAREKSREQKAADAGVRAPSNRSRAADERSAGSSTAAPVVKNLVAKFDGRKLGDLVKEALSGRAEDDVEFVVCKLEEQDIKCVEDIQFLAEDIGTPKELRTWLEKESKLPSLTSGRVSRFLFESAHGPSPRGS